MLHYCGNHIQSYDSILNDVPVCHGYQYGDKLGIVHDSRNVFNSWSYVSCIWGWYESIPQKLLPSLLYELQMFSVDCLSLFINPSFFEVCNRCIKSIFRNFWKVVHRCWSFLFHKYRFLGANNLCTNPDSDELSRIRLLEEEIRERHDP